MWKSDYSPKYDERVDERVTLGGVTVYTLTLQGMFKSYDLFHFCSLWLIWVLHLKSVFACLRTVEQVEY